MFTINLGPFSGKNAPEIHYHPSIVDRILEGTAALCLLSGIGIVCWNYFHKTRGKLPGFIKRFLKLVADCKFCFFIKEMRFFHIECEFDRITGLSCCTRINSCCNLSSVYIEV